MRSANQGEAFFKAGERVNLILNNGNTIGQGFIRRVLNDGAAYAVKVADLTVIMPGTAVFPPKSLIVGEQLHLWFHTEAHKNKSN